MCLLATAEYGSFALQAAQRETRSPEDGLVFCAETWAQVYVDGHILTKNLLFWGETAVVVKQGARTFHDLSKLLQFSLASWFRPMGVRWWLPSLR